MKTLIEFVYYIADREVHNYMDGNWTDTEWKLREAAKFLYDVSGDELDGMVRNIKPAILKRVRGI